MREIDSKLIDPSLRILLSYTMSNAAILQEYEKYLYSTRRKLYGINSGNELIACIGIEFTDLNDCEIKHIAVSPSQRGNKLGSGMIDFVCKKHTLKFISAETDKEAVDFYRRYGFEITSLGEKYPGVERFYCIVDLEQR